MSRIRSYQAAWDGVTPGGLETRVSVSMDRAWPYAEHWVDRYGGGRSAIESQILDVDEGLSESAEVSYAQVETVGRSEQYQTWTGVSSRTIPLTLKFRAEEGSVREALERVQANAMWLEALKYPAIVGGRSISAPPVILSIGRFFAGRVVATQVTVNWQTPVDPSTFLFHGADVECEFTVVRTPGAQSDFRGSTRA